MESGEFAAHAFSPVAGAKFLALFRDTFNHNAIDGVFRVLAIVIVVIHCIHIALLDASVCKIGYDIFNLCLIIVYFLVFSWRMQYGSV